MLLLDLHDATQSHGQLLAQAIMEAVKKTDKLPMGWKHASRYLTAAERESMRSDTIQRFMDIFRSLPPEKEFEASARAGQAKKGWYASSAKALLEVFGPDTPRFAALLASLSPQVSVTENLRNAIRFWERWIDAGRPSHVKDLDRVGEEAVGKPRWSGTVRPDGSQKAGMGWRNNVLAAMTHPEPEKVVLSSGGEVGKVDSFRANLLGDLSRVTNDAWMAHFANIDQELFSSKKGYFAMTAKVRKVAERMGWEPAEVQETIWSFFKALKEKQTMEVSGRKTLEKLTHDDVNDSQDFSDLMTNDKEVRDALERLRNRNLVGSPVERVRDGGQDPEGSPLSAAASRGLAGSLARVSDRAEALKQSEDAQDAATRGYHFPNASEIKWDRRRVTFTLTDPREIREWKEKPRKAEDTYSAVIGSKGGKWSVIRGVTHGTPTVQDNGSSLTISLPFQQRENRIQVKIDPERWRMVERKKQEKAERIMPRPVVA